MTVSLFWENGNDDDGLGTTHHYTYGLKHYDDGNATTSFLVRVSRGRRGWWWLVVLLTGATTTVLDKGDL